MFCGEHAIQTFAASPTARYSVTGGGLLRPGSASFGDCRAIGSGLIRNLFTAAMPADEQQQEEPLRDREGSSAWVGANTGPRDRLDVFL